MNETHSISNKKSGGVLPIVLIVFLILGTLGFIFKDNIKNIFNPISIVATVTSSKLKETDGRTNILILGSDKRTISQEGTNLTDTILVASIGKVDKDVVLISLPRDLWVEWETSEGVETASKINSVYALNKYYTGDNKGSTILMKEIEDVLGMPIHYYGIVTFDLFEKVINTLGGVDVTVENTFTDSLYPVEGKEADPIEANRYQTIHFEKGVQNMDGETALKYARSRHGDNNEGTDFARAKRQQNVISAIKSKVLSAKTLLNVTTIKGLYDDYKNNVDTNVDFGTIQSFYLLSQQINFDKVVSVVLDDRSEADKGGLLYAPEDREPYQGQYVLLPQTNDYTQIHAYVQKFLYGNKDQ